MTIRMPAGACGGECGRQVRLCSEDALCGEPLLQQQRAGEEGGLPGGWHYEALFRAPAVASWEGGQSSFYVFLLFRHGLPAKRGFTLAMILVPGCLRLSCQKEHEHVSNHLLAGQHAVPVWDPTRTLYMNVLGMECLCIVYNFLCGLQKGNVFAGSHTGEGPSWR